MKILFINPPSVPHTSLVKELKDKTLSHKQVLSLPLGILYLSSVLEKNIGKYVGEVLDINAQKIFNLSAHLNSKFYDKRLVFVGDSAHSVHPIAGQGLNMTIRDIKILKSIIQKKINLGLELDSSVLKDFDSKVKSYNFIFAKGIDFTEEYFSINNNFFNFYSNKLFNKINKNIFIKSLLMKFANKGLGI